MTSIEDLIRRIVREELDRGSIVHVDRPARVEVDPRRLYSVASVAERLEMSTDWVYDRIKAGELGVVEFGSTRAKQRIRADVLQAFIDSRSFGGRA